MALDLFKPGAYFRAPGGNIENVPDQVPVISWAAWSINLDAGPVSGWTRSRQLWGAAGIANFPWLHCRTVEDVEYLIQVGEQFSAPAIGCNVEDVFGDKLSLQELGNVLLDFWVLKYEKPVHMATLPHVQNGQGWQHVSFAVAALEIFPDEQPVTFPNGYDGATVRGEIQHAFQEGLKNVTLMFKTKTPMDRQTYGAEFSICHSLYTGDDISPSTASWDAWKGLEPCSKVKPADVPLTKTQVPYTGPYGPPGSGLKAKGPTAIALKRAMIRMGLFEGEFAGLDEHYNAKLVQAMKAFQVQVGISPATGLYGRGSWTAIRAARVPPGRPNAGQYALDAVARKLIQNEANSKMCYPIAAGFQASVCQGLHETGGLAYNWAIDFCAPAGANVLAVEAAKITKLSGSDPNADVSDPSGVFGWSIHYETPMGYRYFSTHYGRRTSLAVGQYVEAGFKLGEVGDQQFRPDHLHLGVTSPLGEADAKKRITAVSVAPRL